MDGIHDMGGRQGFGRIRYTLNAQAFHDPWEVRVNSLYAFAVRSGAPVPSATCALTMTVLARAMRSACMGRQFAMAGQAMCALPTRAGGGATLRRHTG